MADKDALARAEKALAEIEGPRHAHHHAIHDLNTVLNLPPPTSPKLVALHAQLVEAARQECAEAEAGHLAHHEAHKGKGAGGSLQRNIDIAAQDVLDARGERHTSQAFVGGPDHAV